MPHPWTQTIRALERAWSRESAMSPETWSPDVPEKDQCAVTACILYEDLGLPVVRGQAILPDGSVDSHYWSDGIDLTRSQYPVGTVFRVRDGVQGRKAYNYLLENPDLVRRLAILRQRMRAGGFTPAHRLSR